MTGALRLGHGGSVSTGRTKLFLAALVVALLSASATAGRAGEIVRVATDDRVLDRNGDGAQDVIVAGRAVHYDLDFDGRFDYTLAFAFKEYTAAGHREYLASGCAAGVFAELTRKGLDNLCASERVAADWTAAHFREFLYYRDGYGALRIFNDSPENDGRLAGPNPRPQYEYLAVFNPDGTVASVQRGDRTIALATFDYEKNASTGTRLLLPKIERPEDLAGIRAQLGGLFGAAPVSAPPP